MVIIASGHHEADVGGDHTEEEIHRMNEPTIFEAHSSYVLELLFTRNSQTLVSAGMDNVVKLWPVPKLRSIGGLYGLR